MANIEQCEICGSATGRAGKGDDSIYDDNGNGPFCEECWAKETAKETPVPRDVTPTVPGYYWVKQGDHEPTVELISEYNISVKTFGWMRDKFSDCQFDGPILPPARWTDGAK